MERDDEVNGVGNSYAFKYRIHDPRLGRFLSMNPLTKSFPFYSPYQFASKDPTLAVDIDGLESSRIINAAETYIGTPYEFGGKNPLPMMIGFVNPDAAWTEEYWKKTLRLGLQTLSDYYPTHISTKDIAKNQALAPCARGADANGNVDLTDFNEVRSSLYGVFQFWGEEPENANNPNSTSRVVHELGINWGAYSIGIDCSGLTTVCYRADEEKLIKDLVGGSSGQLKQFEEAQLNGLAYVHSDANLVSQGDWLWRSKHVMIATGRVELDDDGNDVSIETIQAASTYQGTIVKMEPVSEITKIGHPFRSSDDVEYDWQGGGPVSLEYLRTVENVNQTVIDPTK